jgi:ectoine hydroxylase-related dioxygenase (phytanoyl-CoA dioxygenase family)
MSYQKFTFTGALTAEQIDFFNQHGFIHFEQYGSEEIVQAIVQSTEQIQEQWIAKDVQKINGVPIKYGKDETGKKIVHRFAFTNLFSKAVSEFASHPDLDALKVLLPEGARLGLEEKDGVVFNHYINTDGSNFSNMGWHTDSARDIFYGSKVQPMLNIGFYLDDSSVEKGGLRILPGTHRQGIWDLLFRKKYYLNTYADKNEVAVEAKRGDLVIHDGRIWHRVATSPLQGEASRRRVMYIPMIVGAYQPKSDKSRTPLYHHLLPLVGVTRYKKYLPNFKSS